MTRALKDNLDLNRLLIAVFTVSVCYGAFIEVLQDILPTGRNASIWDMVANTSGSIMACLLIKIGGIYKVKK